MDSQGKDARASDEPQEKKMQDSPKSEQPVPVSKDASGEMAPTTAGETTASSTGQITTETCSSESDISTGLADVVLRRPRVYQKWLGAQGATSAPARDSKEEQRSSSEDYIPRLCVDDESDQIYQDVKHPTGEFRECPVAPIEIPPPIPPRGVRVAAQMIKPSDSPVRNPIPIESPTSTPVVSPELAAERHSYHVHCSCCNRRMSSSECGVLCCHFHQPHLPSECRARRERPSQPSFDIFPVFGRDLTVEVEKSCLDAPDVVVRCVEEVERWILFHKSAALRAYSVAGPTSEINDIKGAFNTGRPDHVSVSNHDVHSITEAMKRYLKELPNPVFPVEMYSCFIEFATKMDEGLPLVKPLISLVDDMPAAHRSTLKYIFAHFARLIRWQSETETQDTIDHIVRAFTHVLIRPPWDKIVDMVENVRLHNDIIYEFLRNGNWGELTPPIPAPNNIEPPESELSEGVALLKQTAAARLAEADWYWGNVSMEECSRMLRNQPNGSYLVRDSSIAGGYTLALKLAGGGKLIRILCRDHFYGFVEPLEFPSVVGLICWYQCNSMRTYNEALNTRLSHPIRRPSVPEEPSGDVEKEVSRLSNINHVYYRKYKQYIFLYDWHRWFISDEVTQLQTLVAANELVNIVLELIDYTQVSLLDGTDPERNRKLESLELLRTRSDQADELKRVAERALAKVVANIRMLTGEMEYLRPEIKKMLEQIKVWKNWLLKRGKTLDLLDTLLASPSLIAEDTVLRETIQDSTLWLIDCERREAEKLLRTRPDGSFLIRPKPGEDNVNVLSIIYQKKFSHCKIIHTDKGYGFGSPFLNFPTLYDLVAYYHDHSLASCNVELKVCLLFPAKLMHNIVQM